jgi:hypothetical protein
MKVNFIMLFIALAVGVLIAFGFYSGNREERYLWLSTIASGALGFVTLSGVLAVGFNVGGSTGNVRAISILFFIIFLISHSIFSFLPWKLTPYIIINGILFIIYILIGYGVVKALKED